MMQSILIDAVRSHLKGMTDEALARFFRVHILPELSLAQLDKLQVIVDMEIDRRAPFKPVFIKPAGFDRG